MHVCGHPGVPRVQSFNKHAISPLYLRLKPCMHDFFLYYDTLNDHEVHAWFLFCSTFRSRLDCFAALLPCAPFRSAYNNHFREPNIVQDSTIFFQLYSATNLVQNWKAHQKPPPIPSPVPHRKTHSLENLAFRRAFSDGHETARGTVTKVYCRQTRKPNEKRKRADNR